MPTNYNISSAEKVFKGLAIECSWFRDQSTLEGKVKLLLIVDRGHRASSLQGYIQLQCVEIGVCPCSRTKTQFPGRKQDARQCWSIHLPGCFLAPMLQCPQQIYQMSFQVKTVYISSRSLEKTSKLLPEQKSHLKSLSQCWSK